MAWKYSLSAWQQCVVLTLLKKELPWQKVHSNYLKCPEKVHKVRQEPPQTHLETYHCWTLDCDAVWKYDREGAPSHLTSSTHWGSDCWQTDHLSAALYKTDPEAWQETHKHGYLAGVGSVWVGGWVGSRLHSAQTPHSAGSAARTYPPMLAAATPLAAAKAQDILKTAAPGHRLLFTMSENAACRVRVARFIVLKRNLTLKWPKLHFVWAPTAAEFPCQITIHPPVLTWKAVLCRQDPAWNVPLSKPKESVSWSSGVTSVTYFAPDQGLSRPRAHCSVSPPTASKITSNLQGVATGSCMGDMAKGKTCQHAFLWGDLKIGHHILSSKQSHDLSVCILRWKREQ